MHDFSCIVEITIVTAMQTMLYIKTFHTLKEGKKYLNQILMDDRH